MIYFDHILYNEVLAITNQIILIFFVFFISGSEGGIFKVSLKLQRNSRFQISTLGHSAMKGFEEFPWTRHAQLSHFPLMLEGDFNISWRAI